MAIFLGSSATALADREQTQSLRLADISSTQIVAKLNAERKANGLPSVSENPDWSAACHAFNLYAAKNGWDSPNAHQETPGKPGYSSAGDWAARNSVLAAGEDVSWVDADPWLKSAPFHLAAIMNPYVTKVGADELHGRLNCMAGDAAGVDLTRFTSPQVFSFPGPDAKGVPPSEQASEGPYTPDSLIGLNSSFATGFEILAWGVGLSDPSTVRLASASLVGQNGKPVEIRTLDTSNPLALLASGGAIIVPVSPLRDRTTYTASVTFRNDAGATVARSWSFTTGRAFDFISRYEAVPNIAMHGLTAIVTTNAPAAVQLQLFHFVRRANVYAIHAVGAHTIKLTNPTTRINISRVFHKLTPGYYRLDVRVSSNDNADNVVFTVR